MSVSAFANCVPDAQKWEIRPLGIGYVVRRVSLLDLVRHPLLYVEQMNRSNREHLNNFVLQWRGPTTGLHFSSPLTLWFGELKSSHIADSNMSGRVSVFLHSGMSH